jgi:hypothetical protein
VNPFDLSASDLLVWGIVVHLIADWPLQNDWMANNKANLHSAAGYVHAGIHGLALALVFGWIAAPLAVAHLLIDTRKPVVWWSKLIRQTQPRGRQVFVLPDAAENRRARRAGMKANVVSPLYDVGTEVRFWTDQVFHIACIAAAALAVSA